MRRGPVFFIFFVLVGVSACNNVEMGHGKDVNPDAVYFEYRVIGEEDDPMVTCMLRYKFGGPNGTTLLLDEPSKVELDGQVLEADSARFAGVYYETSRPLDSFAGKHTIVFTASNKKQYRETFEYIPFKLAEELPAKIKRAPFTITLENLPKREIYMHLVMTDTAYASNDLNEMIAVVNGKVEITRTMFNRLKNGPVTLELYMEVEQALKEKTKEGGRLFMKYGLKRDFELTE